MSMVAGSPLSEVGAFWAEGEFFARSVANRHEGKAFIFYDGPPFASGLPHYGHLLASIIKDVVPRYWTMRGFRVERRFGWDCHGLPVEFEIDKMLGIKGKEDVLSMGIDKYCRTLTSNP